VARRRPAAEESPAPFYVGASEEVRATLAHARTPKAVKDEYRELIPKLRQRGCLAATYRLSGPVSGLASASIASRAGRIDW